MTDIHTLYQQILELVKHTGQNDARMDELSAQMTATAESHGEIKNMIREVGFRLEQISECDHLAHHEYVRTMMMKQAARTRLLNTVTNELAKKGAIAAVGVILALIWAGASDQIGEFLAKLK